MSGLALQVALIGADTQIGAALAPLLDAEGLLASARALADGPPETLAADYAVFLPEPDTVPDPDFWAACLKTVRAPVLALSSYRVFSGDTAGFRAENDPPDSRTEAGQAWRAYETDVLARPDSLVLRSDRVFSAAGDNLLTRLLDRLAAGEPYVGDTHSRGCPTPADDVARVLAAMLKQLGCGARCQGVYHYCASDITHCVEFAEAVVSHARQFLEVAPDAVSAREGAGEARALLSCRRIFDNFAIKQKPWRQSLGSLVADYCRASAS